MRVIRPVERGAVAHGPARDLDVDLRVRKAIVAGEGAEPGVDATLQRRLHLVAHRRRDRHIRVPAHAEVHVPLGPHHVVERPALVGLDPARVAARTLQAHEATGHFRPGDVDGLLHVGRWCRDRPRAHAAPPVPVLPAVPLGVPPAPAAPPLPPPPEAPPPPRPAVEPPVPAAAPPPRRRPRRPCRRSRRPCPPPIPLCPPARRPRPRPPCPPAIPQSRRCCLRCRSRFPLRQRRRCRPRRRCRWRIPRRRRHRLRRHRRCREHRPSRRAFLRDQARTQARVPQTRLRRHRRESDATACLYRCPSHEHPWSYSQRTRLPR